MASSSTTALSLASDPSAYGSSVVTEPEAAAALIRKRIATFAFLRKVHEGRAHYFDTAILAREDLSPLPDGAKIKKRSLQWFTLGLSVGGILDIDNQVDFVRALLLLVLEYEHYTAKAFSAERMKRIFSRRKSRTPDSALNPFTVQLSLSGAGDYTYLDPRNVPFELDYFQVLYTLCDMMCEAYSKLLESSVAIATPGFPEALQKIDKQLKKTIGVVTAELERLVIKAVADELRALDPLRGLNPRAEDDFAPVEVFEEAGGISD